MEEQHISESRRTEKEFTYVDTAAGGWNTRNNIMRRDEYRPRGYDCGTTFMSFTKDLKHYTAENGTVAGYPGPAHATYLPFDLDNEDNAAQALEDTRTLAQRFEVRYDVPLEALRYYFSGNKGFSVEVPAILFGGFTPSTRLHEVLKATATTVAVDLQSFDACIYEKKRLWRTPNTRHRKSGLYKIHLTPGELLNLSAEEIWELAREPRRLDLPAAEDYVTAPLLRGVYEDALVPQDPPRKCAARPAGASGSFSDNTPLRERLDRWGVEIFSEPVPDMAAVVKYAVRCPWVNEHSGGDASGTYAMQFSDGAWHFKCHHSHCQDRGPREVREKCEPRITIGGRRRRVFATREVGV